LRVYIVQSDHDGIAAFKTAGHVFAPRDLLDQKPTTTASGWSGFSRSMACSLSAVPYRKRPWRRWRTMP